MRTFDLIMWGAVEAMGAAFFVAVVAFGWEPPLRTVSAAAFLGLLYVGGARRRITKANLE